MQMLARFSIARLSILCLALSFHGVAAAQQDALLSTAEQKSLRSKLSKLLTASKEFDESTGAGREKAARAYDKAQEQFQKEWDGKVERKGDLLGSMSDLKAIFDNVFEYGRERALTIRKMTPKGFPPYALSVPRNYSNTTPCPTVVMLPGATDAGWEDCVEWFKKTWEASPAVADVLFHIPALPDELDFDRAPDFLTDEGESVERNRIGQLLQTLGETLRTYNLDRNRMFLDAGKGTCAFAVRAATYFPDRFAGLILRHPIELEKTRIGSLTGVPVLLLSSADTAAAAKTLKAQFDEIGEGQCTILETTDAYPFPGAAEAVSKWMADIRREVNRKHLVIEPNHDQYHLTFWAAITRMDPIHTVPMDKRARIELQADREQNRIEIKSRGIESVYLMLNDSLLDLSKEFTLVINGKAVTDKRTRDFNLMKDTAVTRFDGDFLFPVQFEVQIPEAEEGKSDGGGERR